jgi:hypothetical protein
LLPILGAEVGAIENISLLGNVVCGSAWDYLQRRWVVSILDCELQQLMDVDGHDRSIDQYGDGWWADFLTIFAVVGIDSWLAFVDLSERISNIDPSFFPSLCPEKMIAQGQILDLQLPNASAEFSPTEEVILDSQ